jgi:hypothetical protein
MSGPANFHPGVWVETPPSLEARAGRRVAAFRRPIGVIMAQARAIGSATVERFGETQRKDQWWIGPIATALGFGAFIVYSTFRAIYNGGYELGMGAEHGPAFLQDHSYMISPFYSPLIVLPSWVPAWVSPAFLILWAPAGFRVTCYYYRKAYYRAYFLDPVACAVGEPSSYCGFRRCEDYKGETRLLIFQNLHRYFLYLALLFIVFLAFDVLLTCRWPNGFGLSVGTIVMAVNVALLFLYSTSCHSFRHIVGGRRDVFSRSGAGKLSYRLWTWATMLNKNHMLWAWASLFSVGFADFYIWMVASGRITDYRLI